MDKGSAGYNITHSGRGNIHTYRSMLRGRTHYFKCNTFEEHLKRVKHVETLEEARSAVVMFAHLSRSMYDVRDAIVITAQSVLSIN